MIHGVEPARFLAGCRVLLVVAGTSARSRRAIEDLRRILADHCADGMSFEVADVYQQPELAQRHRVVVVPTLMRLTPAPTRRLIGEFSDAERVLRELGLPRPFPTGTNER